MSDEEPTWDDYLKTYLEPIKRSIEELEKEFGLMFNNFSKRITELEQKLKILEGSLALSKQNEKLQNQTVDYWNPRITALEKEIKTLKPFKANDIELLYNTRKEITEERQRGATRQEVLREFFKGLREYTTYGVLKPSKVEELCVYMLEKLEGEKTVPDFDKENAYHGVVPHLHSEISTDSKPKLIHCCCNCDECWQCTDSRRGCPDWKPMKKPSLAGSARQTDFMKLKGWSQLDEIERQRKGMEALDKLGKTINEERYNERDSTDSLILIGRCWDILRKKYLSEDKE